MATVADFAGQVFDLTPKPENLGRCYELSGERVAVGPGGWQGGFLGNGHEGAVLVHGTIQGFGFPPLGHGWVIEPDGEHVWEPATDKVFPVAIFEALFNPVEHARYTVVEARRAMVTHGHYGPWED